MKTSIPASLPINEESRLLSYLKVKFQPGYFFKKDILNIGRLYGKDKRTFNGMLQSLCLNGMLGQDEKAYYLRSWKFISSMNEFNSQSFEATLKDLSSKKKFEVTLFAAKVTSLLKAIRKGRARERIKGCSDQIALSSGLLAKACQCSVGKVTQLKRMAIAKGMITLAKGFDDYGEGNRFTSKIARRETPGIFLKKGRLLKRTADRIESEVKTYRIKNRKSKQFNHEKAK